MKGASTVLHVCSATLVIVGLSVVTRPTSDPVDFDRDVEPILKAHCVQCHGDNGAARLDLRTQQSILKGGVSGPTVVPGKPDESLLVKRILGSDGNERMPMGFAPLNDKDTGAIKAWIAEGARPGANLPAAKHWAFVPPVRPAVPVVKDQKWVANPIDAFVLARIEKEGLKPSAPADKTTLVRRVTLDLTGLPPTLREVDAFLADTSPGAYEKVVDRLLASPHFGERLALPWLDAARYADSNGFQQDGDTYQYVWRDWVVDALNKDMPFDEFAIEQLAGDLLPNATQDQLVATAFNRNHMLNGEGGAIAEEQRNVVLFDRVDVTATTFLGLTMACARCHDHKYDPLSQRDYYSLMAYFNNVPETGVPPGGGQYRIAEPFIMAGKPKELAAVQALAKEVEAASKQRERLLKSKGMAETRAKWERDVLRSEREANAAHVQFSPWKDEGSYQAGSYEEGLKKEFGPEHGLKPLAVEHPEYRDGEIHPLNQENTAYYLSRTVESDRPVSLFLAFGSDDGLRVWVNGKLVLTSDATRGVVPGSDSTRFDFPRGKSVILMKVVNGGGPGGFSFSFNKGVFAPATLGLVRKLPADRSQEDEAKLLSLFLAAAAPAEYNKLTDSISKTNAKIAAMQGEMPKVMVMSDAMPRVTHVLNRGDYESPLEEVTPRTPEILPPLPKGAPQNRLGLAKWIVSSDNPLTARVQVNRYWQMLFGKGLVRTPENFGKQGEPPINPELLDWLAVDFRESGWRVKRLLKEIVMSNTYRQSSRVSKEKYELDPDNRLLARGARFRMPSFILRDIALSTSGLLCDTIGGKPVYPYQPAGIWDGLSITKERDFTYPQSKGEDLYRRSIYTFWRRTVAPGNMFDSSSRQACTVRASITSTPLHALTTLNDTTWVEAARELASHVMREAGPSPEDRLREAFRRVCARPPHADELAVLVRALDRSKKAYGSSPDEAKSAVSVGASQPDPKQDPVELAAYAAVCLEIYNLDEALTRE